MLLAVQRVLSFLDYYRLPWAYAFTGTAFRTNILIDIIKDSVLFYCPCRALVAHIPHDMQFSVISYALIASIVHFT